MIQAFTEDPRCACWPFWVLELSPEADSAAIEKAARDLLAKFSFGMKGAAEFVSPLGRLKRDDFLIREARAALQDSSRRLLAEFWYVEPEPKTPKAEASGDIPTTSPFPASADDWLRSLGVGLW